MDNAWRGKLLIVLALGVFAAAVLAKLHSPLVEWDDFFLEAAKSWASGISYVWVFDYPPLYSLLLVLPFRFFGATAETARLFNTLPVLATAWLIYLAARNLAGRRAALPAALLYLVNPVTIQGVQSLCTLESSLLPACFALFSYIVSRQLVDTRGRVLSLSLLFALSLWSKFSAPFALISGCFLYLLAFRGRLEKSFISTIVLGVAGGCLLFLVTWSAVSLSLWGSASWASVFIAPFRFLYVSVPSNGGETLFKAGLDFARTAFWFSPFLLYLSAAAILDVLRRGASSPSGFLSFLCVFYFVGHTFIGGSNYGFPKYQAAISPLLYLFAGVSLAGLPGRLTAAAWRYLIVPVFLFSVLMMARADPELLINLRLKQLLFSGDHRGVFTLVFAPLFVYAALPFAAAAVFNRRYGLKGSRTAFIAVSAAALLGTCAALSVKQGLAPYLTSYQYGAAGKDKVVKLVSGKLSGGETVMATPEFLYAFRAAGVSGPGWHVWQSEREMYNFVSERDPGFIIAGWTTQTRAQLEYLLKDEKMRELLEKEYSLLKEGTYFIWENRRGGPAAPAGAGAGAGS